MVVIQWPEINITLVKTFAAMTTHARPSRRFTATLAILIFLFPLVLFIGWSGIGVNHGALNEREQIDIFLSYFPSWLQNFTGITVFSLACCIIAMVLAGRSYKKRLLSVRVLMLLVVIGSIFLIIFNLAQLL